MSKKELRPLVSGERMAGSTRTAAPPVYWSLLGVVSWIATRSLHRVGEIELKLENWSDRVGRLAKDAWLRELNSTISGDCCCDELPCACIDQAIGELKEQLQAGAMQAFGINTRTDDLEFLLPEAFAFARVGFSPVNGLRLLRKVPPLRVRRADVLLLWPPGAKAVDPDECVTPPPVVATAAAVKQCEEWLVRQFADPVNACMTRTDYKRRAVAEVFEGRLSGRGFGTAWNAATEHNPSLRRPGPRRKK